MAAACSGHRPSACGALTWAPKSRKARARAAPSAAAADVGRAGEAHPAGVREVGGARGQQVREGAVDDPGAGDHLGRVGAVIEQQPHQVDTLQAGGAVEEAAAVGPNLGAPGQQQLHRLGAAGAHGVGQRRHRPHVLGALGLVDAGGIRVEEAAQLVEVPEEGGGEHVHRRAAVPQQVRRLPVAPPEGGAEGGQHQVGAHGVEAGGRGAEARLAGVGAAVEEKAGDLQPSAPGRLPQQGAAPRTAHPGQQGVVLEEGAQARQVVRGDAGHGLAEEPAAHAAQVPRHQGPALLMVVDHVPCQTPEGGHHLGGGGGRRIHLPQGAVEVLQPAPGEARGDEQVAVEAAHPGAGGPVVARRTAEPLDEEVLHPLPSAVQMEIVEERLQLLVAGDGIVEGVDQAVHAFRAAETAQQRRVGVEGGPGGGHVQSRRSHRRT